MIFTKFYLKETSIISLILVAPFITVMFFAEDMSLFRAFVSLGKTQQMRKVLIFGQGKIIFKFGDSLSKYFWILKRDIKIIFQ